MAVTDYVRLRTLSTGTRLGVQSAASSRFSSARRHLARLGCHAPPGAGAGAGGSTPTRRTSPARRLRWQAKPSGTHLLETRRTSWPRPNVQSSRRGSRHVRHRTGARAPEVHLQECMYGSREKRIPNWAPCRCSLCVLEKGHGQREDRVVLRSPQTGWCPIHHAGQCTPCAPPLRPCVYGGAEDTRRQGPSRGVRVTSCDHPPPLLPRPPSSIVHVWWSRTGIKRGQG
ncbi:hypothetical protein C8Q80DRAFT_393221 [Daedaleopsis nitida]|nr:hypothetical protein C8Q80DRAFT_393221 [Daedaleopsis nitida]